MNMKIIEDISNFIFLEDTPQVADVILIPGTSKHEISEEASKLYKNGFAKYVLPSGKFSSSLNHFAKENITKEIYKGDYSTDWEYCSKILIYNGVTEKDILKEDKATNTRENAFFSKEVLDKSNIKVEKAIICCQAFHGRRVLMTYSWAFPDTKFYIIPSNTQGITKNNWYKSQKGIDKVLGELKRCGMYFNEYIGQMNYEKV